MSKYDETFKLLVVQSYIQGVPLILPLSGGILRSLYRLTRKAPMQEPPKRRKQAKRLVLQPLFRSRQETPKKGKGSYQRKASRNWEAFCFWACVRWDVQQEQGGRFSLLFVKAFAINPRLFFGAVTGGLDFISPQPIQGPA